MAAHAVASATITFGLVSIPVKLYSSTRPAEGVHFNLLHAKDGSRLRQEYVCVAEGEVVPRDEIVKGYEFAKDEYVTFTKDELKAIEEESTREARIEAFLPLGAIDPVFYQKSYYLAPDRGAAKTYALLRKALVRSQRVAIGRYAARGKDYVVLIRAIADGLAMQQLFHAQEMRGLRDLEIPEVQVGAAELKLARQLIDQLATDRFDAARYRDEVRERIEAAVRRKVEGEEITIAQRPTTGAQVIDLMEALRRSVGADAEPPARAARLAPGAAARRKPARRAAPPQPEERTATATARAPARSAGRRRTAKG